jgi:phosphoglycerol transferase
VIVGVSDQLPPLRSLATGVPGIAGQWHELRAFIADVERRLPAGAAVMQLPVRPYPGDSGIHRMSVYDHFLPYLASRHLRWSYPALSDRQRKWQSELARVPGHEWPTFLFQAGFRAILIDRAAFPDEGRELADALRAAPAAPVTLVENHRYIVLELRRP